VGGVRRIEAVLLDAGGVLVLPDPDVLAPLLAYYGGSTEVAVHRRAHYAAMAAKSRTGAGEIEWADYDRAYVRAVGVADDVADEAASVLGRTRTAHLWRWPIPESLAGLRALHDAAVPLGVVSNASGQIEATLVRSGVCQVGDGPHVPVRVVVDSHVVGVAKPDPGIFELALAHFEGITRDRIAYVGDSVTMDVHGARAAGLHPVLLDPHDDHPELDVSRIATLAELLDALG
jgi:putative hydrolase of the HAD superfamily